VYHSCVFDGNFQFVTLANLPTSSNPYQPYHSVPRRRGNRQWQQLEFVAGNREMGHDILHFGQGDASEFALIL
jgi:hypothetical protein